MNSTTIGLLVRHAITVLGGALINNGLADKDALDALAGGAAAIIAIAWSWYQKRNQAGQLTAAQEK